MSEPAMSRLIDRPGAQRTTTTIVDRPVLAELLWLASSAAEERERYWQWHEEVESGEWGSLTVAEWRESGGGE